MNAVEEATSIIRGDRNADYGDHERESERVAAIWNVLVDGKEITADLVDMMMMTLKMVRETNRHKHDNIVDIVGYSMLMGERHEQVRESQTNLMEDEDGNIYKMILVARRKK
jgi:hypothetical protein